MSMGAALFLCASLAIGISLVYVVPTRLRLEERIAMGVPIGLAIGTLTTFVCGWLAGFSLATIVAVSIGLLVGSSTVWWRSALSRQRLRTDWSEFTRRATTSRFWLGLAIILPFALMLGLIFWSAIFSQHGTIYAGFSNVWGDWNQHLSQTSSFAYDNNFPPELSTMAGQRLSYPFLTNFLSAILIKGGWPLLIAMKLPMLLLALAILALLLTLARLTVGGKASLLIVPLFFLSGGLGFINFFADWGTAHQSLGQFLANLPRNYTQTWGNVVVPNINFINTIFAYLVPQRAFTFGLPLVISIMILLYQAVSTRQRSLFLAAGLIGCLLPLIHSYGLLFLAFGTPVWMLLSWRQLAGRTQVFHWRILTPWLYFIIPLLAVALPQLLWLTHGVDSRKFFHPQYGWTKGTDNIFWFWLKNLWLYAPLLIIGLLVAARRVRPVFAMTAGVGMVFILANLFVFQPWDWDNTKLFAYWYTFSLPAVIIAIVRLAGHSWWRRGIMTVAVGSMLLAGSMDVAKALQPDRYKVAMFDATAQQIGQAVREGTDPHAVFLTGQSANNPVAGLGGRQVVLGYTGWLWSYGLDYRQREADVKIMYEGRAEAAELLRHYGVTYVVFGPGERTDKGYAANETYYRDRYQLWREFGPVQIYDLTKPR